jgi:hypothetical protein
MNWQSQVASRAATLFVKGGIIKQSSIRKIHSGDTVLIQLDEEEAQ